MIIYNGYFLYQVNAGPLAYAEAFLAPGKVEKQPADKVKKLKEVFIEFVHACKDALGLNAKLISTDQKEYHESLKNGFGDIVERLSNLLGETVSTFLNISLRIFIFTFHFSSSRNSKCLCSFSLLKCIFFCFNTKVAKSIIIL